MDCITDLTYKFNKLNIEVKAESILSQNYSIERKSAAVDHFQRGVQYLLTFQVYERCLIQNIIIIH
jgi:hypothetical protein